MQSIVRAQVDPSLSALRNRFSILLTVIRSRLSSREYSQLLQGLREADKRLLDATQPLPLRRQLVDELNGRFDRMFEILDRGDFSRSELTEIVRVHSQVFQ